MSPGNVISSESSCTTALFKVDRVRAALEGAEGGEGEAGAAHASVERAAGALDRALIEFNEAEEALSEAAARFDVEPGRLNEVEERLFALRAAARKHHVDVDELAELRDRLASRLDMIEHADDRLKEAEGALKAAEADYGRAAKALTAKRKSAGDTLAGAVEAL